VESLHDLTCCAPSDIPYEQCLGCVAGKGLFAQHMLAGVQCIGIPLGVQRVDERVVNDLDLWVVNDFRVRLVHLFDATLCRECLGSGSVARSYSDQLVAEQLRRLDDSVIGDPSRAEDTDLERAN
jgi:hypothetical protein